MIEVNPGTGPLPGARPDLAAAAMAIFCEDLRHAGIPVIAFSRCPGDDDGDGRYAFSVLFSDETLRHVQMPGLPVGQARYLGPPHHVRDFPRLYVDGASFLWLFALDVCRPLTGQEVADEWWFGAPSLAGEIRGYPFPVCPECGACAVSYHKTLSADCCGACGWTSDGEEGGPQD
jgi:hypothetical protein